MRTLLFFDDFLLNRQTNLVRRWYQPEWLPEEAIPGNSYDSVAASPGGGHYLYQMVALPAPGGGKRTAMVASESADGLHWTPIMPSNPTFPDFPQAVHVAPAKAGIEMDGNVVICDPDDPDPSRRYKMTESLLERSDTDSNRLTNGELCRSYLLYSADGLHWREDRAHPFLPRHTDTCIALLRNSHTGRYQIHLRRAWGDRRIHRVESADLEHWTEPQLVLHPSPLDPPMTLFYGMRQFEYGDMFLGFLWRYQTVNDDLSMWKMQGPMDTELVYSYDGLTWNRTHRAFLPLAPRGEYGAGMNAGAFVIAREDDLLVHTGAWLLEHHHWDTPIPDGRPTSVLLPGRMRKDGFVSVGNRSAVGEFTTDALHLRSPELSLNLRAGFGEVRVQVADYNCRPLPGYTFEECEPIQGDHLALHPRWKNHPDLAAAQKLATDRGYPAKGRVRLQARLDQAEIFSITGDFGLTPLLDPPGMDYL